MSEHKTREELAALRMAAKNAEAYARRCFDAYLGTHPSYLPERRRKLEEAMDRYQAAMVEYRRWCDNCGAENGTCDCIPF